MALEIYVLPFARWLKYEEKVEAGERWSKPHVPTAALHALFQIRNCIADNTAIVLLDMHTNHGCIHQVAGTSHHLSTRWQVRRATAARSIHHMTTDYRLLCDCFQHKSIYLIINVEWSTHAYVQLCSSKPVP